MASFDSLAVFEADGSTILNANDALAIKSVANVLPSLGQVDLLMGHYGGAGPFPQCFADMTEDEKVAKGRMLAEGFLHRLSAAAKMVKARYVMPFAGQYVLGGRLSTLNKYRSVVPLTEALEWVATKTDSTPIAMAPFSSFDVSTGVVERVWEEPSAEDIDQYMARIAEHSFPYEKAPVSWPNAEGELRDALEGVAAEYRRRLALGEDSTTHRISIATSTVSGHIDFHGASTMIQIGPVGEMVASETRLTCHPNLLKGLIQRAEGFSGFTPMHFNQAEIGSHFEWRRTGDFNEVVRCLNFMQVGSDRRLALVGA
jgi:UDP-MurNAc hydroxylase